MNNIEYKNILFLLLIIGFLSLNSYGQKSLFCLKTENNVASGSTFFMYDNEKLKKTIKGSVTYPDGSIAKANIIIFKNQFNKNEQIDYEEVEQIEIDENEIGRCATDKNGKFKIKGLDNGYYLLKIGLSEVEGFGPMYMLVEISRSKGKKKTLGIYLDSAI